MITFSSLGHVVALTLNRIYESIGFKYLLT
jgi:hypothetical protein